MTISSDLIVLVGVIGLFAAFGFIFGKKRLLALILSFYFGLILYFNFPYLQNIIDALPSQSGSFYGIMGVFGIFSAFAFFLLGRLISAEFSFGIMKFGELGALSLVGSGLLLMLLINVAAVSKIYSFSPQISQVFTFPNALFWWLTGSLVVILLFSRK